MYVGTYRPKTFTLLSQLKIYTMQMLLQTHIRKGSREGAGQESVKRKTCRVKIEMRRKKNELFCC